MFVICVAVNTQVMSADITPNDRIQTQRRRVPMIEPWGTPKEIVTLPEKNFSRQTGVVRPKQESLTKSIAFL